MIKRGLRKASAVIRRKAGRKVRTKVKGAAKEIGKEVRKPWTTGHMVGATVGLTAAGEYQRRRHGKKQLKKGRAQGLVAGAHLTRSSRNKVRKAYKQARKQRR